MDKDVFLIKLGTYIVQIRNSKNISQAELARLCDKDPQSIDRLEKGKINPSIFYLYQISIGLKVELKDLLNFPFSNNPII